MIQQFWFNNRFSFIFKIIILSWDTSFLFSTKFFDDSRKFRQILKIQNQNSQKRPWHSQIHVIFPNENHMPIFEQFFDNSTRGFMSSHVWHWIILTGPMCVNIFCVGFFQIFEVAKSTGMSNQNIFVFCSRQLISTMCIVLKHSEWYATCGFDWSFPIQIFGAQHTPLHWKWNFFGRYHNRNKATPKVIFLQFRNVCQGNPNIRKFFTFFWPCQRSVGRQIIRDFALLIIPTRKSKMVFFHKFFKLVFWPVGKIKFCIWCSLQGRYLS